MGKAISRKLKFSHTMEKFILEDKGIRIKSEISAYPKELLELIEQGFGTKEKPFTEEHLPLLEGLIYKKGRSIGATEIEYL